MHVNLGIASDDALVDMSCNTFSNVFGDMSFDVSHSPSAMSVDYSTKTDL